MLSETLLHNFITLSFVKYGPCHGYIFAFQGGQGRTGPKGEKVCLFYSFLSLFDKDCARLIPRSMIALSNLFLSLTPQKNGLG